MVLLCGCREENQAATPAPPTVVAGGSGSAPGTGSNAGTGSPTAGQTLSQARAGFQTVIVRGDPQFGPADVPPADIFEITTYTSPVGELPAYVTPDPGDGQRRPAIIWIAGGDCNSIGDVWSPQDPSNDQSAIAFREQGIVMMFPSLRGGNDNPGQREGFYGEVDDILAAADYLAQLPYVDPTRIYLGGHSTGGTLVLLVAECSGRFAAVFSFGPVASILHYDGDYYFSDPNSLQETSLRDPVRWLSSIESPVYVFEGMIDGNWPSIAMMQTINKNALVQFFPVHGHDHFSVLHPVTQILARQIQEGQLQIDQSTLNGL
jgi:hypothetical protein